MNSQEPTRSQTTNQTSFDVGRAVRADHMFALIEAPRLDATWP
jgi:hypothetical protein